jgi:hypothetical protein
MPNAFQPGRGSADVLSSTRDGFSEYQAETLQWIKQYNPEIK